MNPGTPPRIAIWLLESLLPEEDRDAVVGDLIEESALRARASTRATATWWCWGQVARSIPLVLWSDLRRGHWFGTLGVAIVAYVAASVLESVGVALVFELLHPDPRLAIVLSAIVGLATMVLGGYVVASIRQGAAPALAGIIFIVVAVLFATIPNSAPLWYGLTFLIAGPVAALAGGWLKVTRRTGRPPRAA
jgi:drug/metabolite transporter superfamily protein YnfA